MSEQNIQPSNQTDQIATGSEYERAGSDFSNHLQQRFQQLFDTSKNHLRPTGSCYEAETQDDGTVVYRMGDRFSTSLGNIYVVAETDYSSAEGYVSDDAKSFQRLKIWLADGDNQFQYSRTITEGVLEEEFVPEDMGELPDLSVEEQKIASDRVRLLTPDEIEQMSVLGDEAQTTKDVDGVGVGEGAVPSLQAKLNYFVDLGDGRTAITTRYSDALDSSIAALREQLRYERFDKTMNLERQKKVLGALDAALWAAEIDLSPSFE